VGGDEHEQRSFREKFNRGSQMVLLTKQIIGFCRVYFISSLYKYKRIRWLTTWFINIIIYSKTTQLNLWKSHKKIMTWHTFTQKRIWAHMGNQIDKKSNHEIWNSNTNVLYCKIIKCRKMFYIIQRIMYNYHNIKKIYY